MVKPDSEPVSFSSIEAGDVTDPALAVRVKRAQRTVRAWRSTHVRTLVQRTLWIADIGVVLVLLSLPVLHWYEFGWWWSVQAMMLVAVLLGVWTAGGYRVEGRASRAAPQWASLASITAMSLLWALLKLLSSKAGWGLIAPPTALTFAIPVTLMGLWAFVSRILATRIVHDVTQHGTIVVLGDAPIHQMLDEEFRANEQPQPLLWVDRKRSGTTVAAQLEAALQQPISYIVLATPLSSLNQDALSLLIDARVALIPVVSLTQIYEELWERIPLDIDDLSWIFTDNPTQDTHTPLDQGMRRLLDIFGALTLLLLSSPLIIGTMIAIKLTDPGPIFFRQTREGQWKTPFTIVKFRTMVVDAEKFGGAQWSTENDPRITRLGRFLRRTRIDELPQLFNVLAGSMALVGPRPERPEFNERLATHIPFYDLRNAVKPGVTGWAQVNYPYGASIEDAVKKLEYDTYYIRHASLWFDLLVLSRTVMVVLGMKGR